MRTFSAELVLSGLMGFNLSGGSFEDFQEFVAFMTGGELVCGAGTTVIVAKIWCGSALKRQFPELADATMDAECAELWQMLKCTENERDTHIPFVPNTVGLRQWMDRQIARFGKTTFDVSPISSEDKPFWGPSMKYNEVPEDSVTKSFYREIYNWRPPMSA